MIAERPGGVSPTDPSKSSQDTKAQREHAQKIEKVREIDADEEAQKRRRRFQMMMGDEDQLAETSKGPRAPSPFEVEFHKAGTVDQAGPNLTVPPAPGSTLFGDGSDMDNEAIVPSPSYSPPPNVSSAPETDEGEEDLPHSQSFWENTDLPTNGPTPSKNFQETPKSAAKKIGEPGQGTGKPKAVGKEAIHPPAKQGKEAPSPFGAPGKTVSKKEKGTEEPVPYLSSKVEGRMTQSPQKQKQPEQKKESPFAPPLEEKEAQGPAPRMRVDEENPFETVWQSTEGKGSEKTTPPSKAEIREREQKEREREAAIPSVSRGKEGKGEGKQKGPILEIAPPMLPALPAAVQPMAVAAAQQATPYLSPETIPLYFQMVGTIMVMTTPPGVSRTEILLNNPIYSNSRFFGARITIEKYATAPNSFNIRLSGSDTAVVAFKENIPSLMTAFQNGNFNFRINRLEAEFSIDRPVFRRKERGEGGSEFGGDLGERRK